MQDEKEKEVVVPYTVNIKNIWREGEQPRSSSWAVHIPERLKQCGEPQS